MTVYENKRNGIKANYLGVKEAPNGSIMHLLHYCETNEEKVIIDSTFKRWWKKIEVAEEPEQVEEVVDNEENLSDEAYAKIGVEISEQAKEKLKKSKKQKKSRVDRSKELLEIDSFIGNNYDNKYYESVKCYKITKEGKTVAEVYPRRKHIEVRVKTIKEDFDSDIVYKDGYKYYLPVHYFIDYSMDYIKLIEDIVG